MWLLENNVVIWAVLVLMVLFSDTYAGFFVLVAG